MYESVYGNEKSLQLLGLARGDTVLGYVYFVWFGTASDGTLSEGHDGQNTDTESKVTKKH